MFAKHQSYYLADTIVTMSDYKECGLARKIKVIKIIIFISI